MNNNNISVMFPFGSDQLEFNSVFDFKKGHKIRQWMKDGLKFNNCGEYVGYNFNVHESRFTVIGTTGVLEFEYEGHKIVGNKIVPNLVLVLTIQRVSAIHK